MKRKPILLFASALLCILSACGANDSGAPDVLSAEPSAAPTLAPTPTATPIPTPTPAPVDVYGVTVCWNDAEIDLRTVSIDDAGAALSEALSALPQVHRVDMTGCGLSNQEMGALQEAFPDVSFAWRLNLYTYFISADADFFIPNPDAGFVTTGIQHGPHALWYCRDLRALDLGHTGIHDISFLEVMPHLRYLILAANPINDLTLVGKLQELEWLELFQTYVQDLSPLLGCTALHDLNICYIPATGEEILATLSQMPWLRRLWVVGCNLTYEQIDELRAALPDTEIWYATGDESTGGTWRLDNDYYDMRDAFHMYYMDAVGNNTKRLTEEELADAHKKHWGY